MPAPDAKKDLLFFFLFLLLFLLTFREFFFTGRVFFERDTTVVEIPARRLTVSLLKEGNFALWTDAYGNGQPFLANPKNAVFYPATLLYLVLPLFTAFKLYYFVHVILGWIGLYRLCKSYALSEKAAFLGATLFALSGMYLSSFEFYNHIAALAWMPWILLLLNRGPGAGLRRFVTLTILWALLILAGSPEVIVLTALLALAQTFIEPLAWMKRLASVALPFVLACLLCAIQLVPSMEMLAKTGRESQSVDWPLELLQLPNLAFADLLGNDREPGRHDYWGWHLFDRHFPLYYSLYMGFGALLLFLSGLGRPWDRRRKVMLATFAVFFLLACGRYSPFFFLYRFTPFVSSIRYPVKFFLGSVFCLAILAAFGLDRLTSGAGPGKKAVRNLAVTAGLSLVLFLVFKARILALLNALMVIEKDASLGEFGRSIATGLVLLAAYAAIFMLMSAARMRGAVLSWALLTLVLADPAFHNRWINPTVPASFFARPPLLADLKPPVTVYRAEDYFLDRREKSGSNVRFLAYYRGTLYPLSAMSDGVRYVFNIDFYGTYPKRYAELVREARKLPVEGQLKVLEYLGCDYYISDNPMFSKDTARRLQVEGFPVFIESIPARPRGPSAVFSTRHAVTPEEKLRIFTGRDFDPLETAITEEEIPLAGRSEAVPGLPAGSAAVSVRKSVQGRGRYEAELPREGIVVFPGNFARGWRAWIDGRSARVFEVNLFAKGVLVPPGKHEIVLRYLPGSFLLGAAVSLATGLFLLAGALVLRPGLRKKVRPASP
ncbi:MAG: hypothetical protein ACXVI6_00620 [Candidatus Aminicenantales bacterium]